MPEYVTLYLDESGEKDWPTPWGRSSQTRYVLAGPVLTPSMDLRAHRAIPEIIKEFFPRAAFTTEGPKELHYGDLINHRPPYDHLSAGERTEMANRVWDLILELRPALIGSVLDKRVMKERYGTDAWRPNELALTATIDRFDRHLEEKGCVGMVMMDTESLQADRRLSELIHRAKTSGIKVLGWNYLVKDRTLDRVLNSVTFSPSQMSPGIQLADFIAYATFSHFERGKSRRFEQVARLWREAPGGFREPSLIPKPKEAKTEGEGHREATFSRRGG